MKLLGHILITIAWFIPGGPRRWSKRLKAERRAGREWEVKDD